MPSTLAVDATSVPYFKEYVHDAFRVEYLLFVASQYGQRLVNVYAFGSFPPGYKPKESEIRSLEPMPMREGIGPVEGNDPPVESRPSDGEQNDDSD